MTIPIENITKEFGANLIFVLMENESELGWCKELDPNFNPHINAKWVWKLQLKL